MRGRTLLYTVLIVLVAVAGFRMLANGQTAESAPQADWKPQVNGAPIGDDIPLNAATIRRVAAKQTPAVVNIRTESRRQTRNLRESLPEGMFDFFFGPRKMPPPGDEILEGAGTGFIIDPAGRILTNNHVVEGATVIEVGLFPTPGDMQVDEGELYTARVIGRDPLTDSALIELTEKPAKPLTAVTFGDSDQMAPGDWVIAIGNPFNLQHTVTVGVVSAKGRPFAPVAGRVQEMLQTDAAINPGNSGGPLLNLRGDVIGINSAILSNSPRTGNLGIGFAVPINAVRELLPQLRTGKVTRGWIGVRIQNVPPEAADEFGLKNRDGVVVAAVEPGGPSADAGLQPGDVIVEYNGKPVANSTELTRMVVATAPDASVPVRVIRDKQTVSLTVRVESLNLAEQTRGPNGDPETAGFGLSLDSVPPNLARRIEGGGGALVRSVDRGSAAAAAGVQEGDIILQVNRQPVDGAEAAAQLLRQAPKDASVFVLVWRDGQRLFLTMTREE